MASRCSLWCVTALKQTEQRTTPATATATATTLMTDVAIRVLISQGVADALAKHEIQRNNNLNGDVSQGSRSGITRPVRPTHEMETVFNISNCAVENQVKFAWCCINMVEIPCQDNQEIRDGDLGVEDSDKIKRYVGGLPDMVHGSVMASKPKTTQDAVEFVTELMDKKIRTFAKCQTENKRKFEDTSRNN
ncbi:hypothetical protein Tco_0509702 [Tanacetum coccineum]